MVRKSIENGYSVAPFLLKCYEMVDDESTDPLISWGSTNDSFVIWNESQLSSELLPKYFKHSNFSSFVRQLNIYGFRKTDTDRWEFANDGFIKGQKHLLKNIIRRKHTQHQGPVQQRHSEQKDKNVGSCEENKNDDGLWKEVESLKTDKNVLMQELINLRQHQETSQSKLLLLREQLKGMEKNQQQMLSFIVMAMQSPGFLVQLIQPKNILKHVTEDHEAVAPSDGAIIRYQPPTDEPREPLCVPNSNSVESMEFDLSSDEVKDLFMNIDFTSNQPDEKLIPSENHGLLHGPLIFPDLADGYGMLEQLLASPHRENNGDAKLDTEDPTDSGMELEPTCHTTHLKESDNCKFLIDGSRKSQNLKVEAIATQTQLDNSQNMEILTDQMGLLASESSPQQ